MKASGPSEEIYGKSTQGNTYIATAYTSTARIKSSSLWVLATAVGYALKQTTDVLYTDRESRNR